MQAETSRYIIILNGRGQLFHTKTSTTPVVLAKKYSVNYASCANLGVCAMGQPDAIPIIIGSYTGMTPKLLRTLDKNYQTYHEENIEHRYQEFEYQQDEFWTKKELKYDKLLRFYPRPGDNSMFELIVVDEKGNQVNNDYIESINSSREAVKLSTLLDTLQELLPGVEFDVYDPGCLKLMPEEPLPNGEPDQKARIFPHDITFAKRGGTKRKRNRKRTKRTKRI